ncbi:MAG: hypothetical protein ACXVA0_24500, partial [Mucilaginibacter sp.]
IRTIFQIAYMANGSKGFVNRLGNIRNSADFLGDARYYQLVKEGEETDWCEEIFYYLPGKRISSRSIVLH